MLTRLTATASVVFLGAALAVALPAGTARADCKVINGVVTCQASGNNHKPGSEKKGRHGGRGGGLGPGCADQANGVPGAICPINPPAPVQRIPSIDLALSLRDSLQPPSPEIHWSPDPRTYVQLRTGLWIDPGDYQPLAVARTVAGQTVTAHVTPDYVEWNLVEFTIRCKNAGSADGTACGYTYKRSSADQPGGKYHITATIHWAVNWQCAGACDPGAGGPLDPIQTTSAADIPVDEIQTESQPG